MTQVNDLLKPRYKVIADWPNCAYNVGQILTQDDRFPNDYWTGDQCYTDRRPDRYPHLFKPLEWWEDREPGEMPEYIRLNQIMVVKVAKHHSQRHDEFQAHDTKYNYPYGICKPATEQEYLSYIQSKTK